MAAVKTATRWERVQEILDRAHTEAPVYAGAGRFWAELDTLLPTGGLPRGRLTQWRPGGGATR